jgi:GNAT superfamily N-acetyltransferase
MIRVTYGDKNQVVNILTASFRDNESVNYIVRGDGRRWKRIRALMDYAFEVGYRFGEIWLSDDGKACALLLFPHLKRTTWFAVWLDLRLFFEVIGLGGLRKAVRREARIKRLQFEGDMVYLWFLGVSPDSQRQGTGSLLLEQLLGYADQMGLPVCLETSTLENMPWYGRFGFRMYTQLDLGYVLFFLKREPGG